MPSDAIAVYDLLVATLRGQAVQGPRLDRACQASLDTWEIVVGAEGVGPQAHAALVDSPIYTDLSEGVRSLLRRWGQTAFRESLLLPPQLAEIARVAAQKGIRLLALKGAARLLSGERAGARTTSDIDLLVPKAEAGALHELLQRELAYRPLPYGPEHHLAALVRPLLLRVEIHTALSRQPSPLDDLIWRDTRSAVVGDTHVEIPSATSLALHTLEHAVVGHREWTYRLQRYRLRDITDLAATWNNQVDASLVLDHVRRSRHRRALETALSAAQELRPVLPKLRAGSWSTVRRVARTRLWISPTTEPDSRGGYLSIFAAVLAEGSTGELLRLSCLPFRRPSSVMRALAPRSRPADPTPHAGK
jgi:hypothetical protein